MREQIPVDTDPPDSAVDDGPSASADYDATASVLLHCDPLYLSGASSSGEAPLTYAWDLLSIPPGSARSAADIVEVSDAAPTFVPDIAGLYSFGLTVSDATGASSERADLSVEIGHRVNNAAPVVDPGEDQTLSETVECTPGGYGVECDACSIQEFSVRGEITDADGDDVTYSWSLVAGDSKAVIDDTSALETTVTLLGPEGSAGETTTNRVVLQLSATDCYGESASAELTLAIDCVAE